MTAKKATLTKEQTAGVEKVGLEEIHDAKSAEAADVAQEEDEKQDPLLGQGQKASEAEGNAGAAYNLAERVTDQRELLLSLTTQVLRLKEQVNTKAPEELGEWIADVESKISQRFSDLEHTTRDLVVQHHDRLLDLEMKVTGLIGGGKDDDQPG